MYQPLKPVVDFLGEYFAGVSTMYDTGRASSVANEMLRRDMLTARQKSGLGPAVMASFGRNAAYAVLGKFVPDITTAYFCFRAVVNDGEARNTAWLVVLASEGVRIGMQLLNEWRPPRKPYDDFFRKNNLEDKVKRIEEDLAKTI